MAFIIPSSGVNPVVSPRTSGPETASSLTMPSQGYPCAVLDPRFHSQTQPQPQSGDVHPVGMDQWKEAGRNVSGGHNGVVGVGGDTAGGGGGVCVYCDSNSDVPQVR